MLVRKNCRLKYFVVKELSYHLIGKSRLIRRHHMTSTIYSNELEVICKGDGVTRFVHPVQHVRFGSPRVPVVHHGVAEAPGPVFSAYKRYTQICAAQG